MKRAKVTAMACSAPSISRGKSLVDHDVGIVIKAEGIGPVGPMRSRKGVTGGVATTGVELVASNGFPDGAVISGQNSTSAPTPTSLTRSAKLLRAYLAGGRQAAGHIVEFIRLHPGKLLPERGRDVCGSCSDFQERRRYEADWSRI